jgi:hypothetical protein
MKCDVASSTSAYTVIKGYLLDMATFDEGSFFANGSAMPESMQPAMMRTTISSMTTTMAARDTTIVELQADKTTMATNMAARDATIVELQADKTTMAANMAARDTTIVERDATIVDLQVDKSQLSEETKETMPTWAIALIVVVGAILLMVLVILAVLVSQEQAGKPVFMATVKNVAVEKF